MGHDLRYGGQDDT